MIVAIDGHAGAGKSSLGKRLARELGMLYIDTGALYRAIALYWVRQNQSPAAEASSAQVQELLSRMRLGVEARGEDFRVILDGDDVTDRLRDREVGEMASTVARLAPVRAHLTELTRSFARLGGLVVDGRDIGTVVFPGAEVKVFLTASPEVRALRRYQDSAGGRAATMEQTQAEIVARDERDSSRTLAPLAAAADATCIDTTELDLEEAYETLLGLVLRRKKA